MQSLSEELFQIERTWYIEVFSWYRRIEVACSPSGFFLCQRRYTIDNVKEACILGAKPFGFPIEQNHKLGLAKGNVLTELEAYHHLVGCLIYLSGTRLDLGYSFRIMSQFMQFPCIEHWEVALRIVKYLKGTPRHPFTS